MVYAWAAVIAHVFPVVALGQVDTPRPASVDNRQLPAMEAADLMQSSLTLYPGSSRVAWQLEQGGIKRKLWPSSISRGIRALEAEHGGTSRSGGLSVGVTTSGTPPTEARPVTGLRDDAGADDIQFLDRSWLEGRMRVQRLAMDGRTFYLLLATREHVNYRLGGSSQPPPTAPPYKGGRRHEPPPNLVSYVFVAVEEGVNTSSATFSTEGEPPVIHRNVTPPLTAPFAGPGEFAAVPWEDGIAVFYRDRGGIFARRLNIGGEAPAFEGERWRIAAAPDTIARYQLLARTDASGTVHLLWAMAAADDRETLHYCRLAPHTGNDCPRPVELSRSVAVSEQLYPVNLMLQGENIYVSWTDTRYASGVWTTRNYAKLLVNASHDGGRSFGKPVALNKPRSNADQARYAVTLPAQDGGVLAFWITERMPAAGMWQRHRFHAGWLDAGLKRLQVGTNTVSGEYINDVIGQGFLKYHEGLGR